MGSINRRIPIEAGLGLKQEVIAKIPKTKRAGSWFKWNSTCLAIRCLQFNPPVPPKAQQNKEA
jgi:hypothetical protein